MGSYQIWPCHVTQGKHLSFPYLKSYCPLNLRKSHQISWFCCIPNGSYKKDDLKEGRIGLSTPLNVIHVGLGLDLALYWMFHSFQIISHFPDLKTRLLLNVSHFPNNFAISRFFCIFQIWKRGLTFSDVSHFPDCFAASRLCRIFQKIPQFRKDFTNSS